eukprot:751961-Hanusia_phi.AAC.1
MGTLPTPPGSISMLSCKVPLCSSINHTFSAYLDFPVHTTRYPPPKPEEFMCPQSQDTLKAYISKSAIATTLRFQLKFDGVHSGGVLTSGNLRLPLTITARNL